MHAILRHFGVTYHYICVAEKAGGTATNHEVLHPIPIAGLSPMTKVLIRPQVAHECIEGEVIIPNLDTGFYHALNDIAATIWTMIAGGTSLETIVNDLALSTGVSDEVVKMMVASLVRDLEQQDLIDIEGESSRFVDDSQDAVVPKGAHDWPRIETYQDMKAALLLDPIHEVDETGWPSVKPDEPADSE
jgi:hypothetical protein